MASETPVRLIAQDGALDALSPDAYREIYDELRGYDAAQDAYALSLDKFVAAFGSGGPTKAEWSRYHRGERELSREMRTCLRSAVGLPALSPTLEEVVKEYVEPNARVYLVGEDAPALRVVLLATLEPVTIHANGDVKLLSAEVAEQGQPHPAPLLKEREKGDLTPALSKEEGEEQVVRRRTAARAHVSVARSAFEQANTMRQYFGLSWEGVLDIALEVLAKQAAKEAGDADATVVAAG